MIGRLIDQLREAGVDPSPEEVLDALWLASRVLPRPRMEEPRGAVAPPHTGEPVAPPQAASAVPASQGPSYTPPTFRPMSEPPREGHPTPGGAVRRPERNITYSDRRPSAAALSTGAGIAPGTPKLELPGGLGLPAPVEIARALRPLRQRTPSRSGTIVDEEATAARLADALLAAAKGTVAESGLGALDIASCRPAPVTPALRPSKERRLGLAIVADGSRTMVLWREVLTGVARLLRRAGGIADAAWYEMDVDAPAGAFALRRAGDRGKRASAVPAARWAAAELPPGRRRAVLFLTDAVSAGFRRPEMSRWLSDVARRAPFAIVPMLPPWFWDRTGLAAHGWVEVGTGSIAGSNEGLSVASAPASPRGRRGGVPVPIVSLEGRALAAWARLVSGVSTDRLPAIQVLARDGKGAVAAHGPAGRGERPGSRQPEHRTPDAETRLRRFRDVCSATALRLATLSAAVPLTLPIMSFVARTMVPGARTHHLAEVMLGGLLRETVADVRRAGEDQVQYEMHDGVRERLLTRTTSGEILEVVHRTGVFLEGRLGRGFGLHALLPSGRSGRRPPPDPRAASFLQVAERVLLRLGVAAPDGDEGKLRVFISFAPQDEDLLKELENHLAPLVQTGRVTIWHAGRLMPGDHGRSLRDRHLGRADLCLVLLTTHYAFLPETKAEWERLRDEHRDRDMQVIQISARRPPKPFSLLQVLELPAIASLEDRDSAWVRVAREVEREALHNTRLHPPIRVFISAAAADHEILIALERHLSLLRGAAEIDIKHRGHVEAGQDVRACVERWVAEAQIILVLVSADYFDDGELYGHEVSLAFERRSEGAAVVIPIRARPAAIAMSPLGELEHLPANRVPISRWRDIEAALADVTAHIEDLIERYRRNDGWEESQTISIPKPRSDGPPATVAILASEGAEGHRSMLIRHLAVLRRHGAIRSPEAGEPVDRGSDRSLSLLLCTRDLSAEPALVAAAVRASETGGRVIPILVDVSPAGIPLELNHLYALPRGGRPVQAWEDADEAWQEVCTEIAGVAADMNEGPPSRGASQVPVLFDCYAWNDAAAHDTLYRHLSTKRAAGALRIHHVNRAGASFAEGLHDADMVVLLVSRSFLDSRFCMEQAALAVDLHRKRQALGMVVLMEDVSLPEDLEELKKVPDNGMPIAAWKKEEDPWVQVADQIAAIARRRFKSGPPPR